MEAIASDVTSRRSSGGFKRFSCFRAADARVVEICRTRLNRALQLFQVNSFLSSFSSFKEAYFTISVAAIKHRSPAPSDAFGWQLTSSTGQTESNADAITSAILARTCTYACALARATTISTYISGPRLASTTNYFIWLQATVSTATVSVLVLVS